VINFSHAHAPLLILQGAILLPVDLFIVVLFFTTATEFVCHFLVLHVLCLLFSCPEFSVNPFSYQPILAYVIKANNKMRAIFGAIHSAVDTIPASKTLPERRSATFWLNLSTV